MSTIHHIRTLFGLSQRDFAAIAGTTQPTVSRWENGEVPPAVVAMSRIRDEAKRRGLAWDDGLFFEVPAQDNA